MLTVNAQGDHFAYSLGEGNSHIFWYLDSLKASSLILLQDHFLSVIFYMYQMYKIRIFNQFDLKSRFRDWWTFYKEINKIIWSEELLEFVFEKASGLRSKSIIFFTWKLFIHSQYSTITFLIDCFWEYV